MTVAFHTACDAACAGGPPQQGATQHPKWVLATTILASSLAFVDGSVVNVGLPALGASLKAGAGDLQWVINAYLLPLSALLLLGGAAGDRFGRVRLLVAGTSLFGVASVACELAPSLDWLLVGRGLQGVGAAMLMPNSLAILGASFSGEARGRAIGIWASMGAVMGAGGPVLGGWLIDTVGWRAIFLINLPLAIGAVLLALLFVKEVDRDKAAGALDLAGGLMATASLGAMTWALTVGSGAVGWSPIAITTLVAGIALILAFLLVEKTRGDAAMMPLALFGSSSFIGLTVLTFLLYGALGALLVLIPYVLIQAAGYSGAAAGAALLPFALVFGRDLADYGQPSRPGRAAPAVVDRAAGGRDRVSARASDRIACRLLDDSPASDPGDFHWHGRRCRTADDGGAGLGRQPTHRLGFGLEQRGRTHRRHGRHRSAGWRPRCVRLGAHRQLSYRGDPMRPRLRGRRRLCVCAGHLGGERKVRRQPRRIWSSTTPSRHHP